MNSTLRVSSLLVVLLMAGCSTHKTESPKSISELNDKVSKIRFNYIDSDINGQISEKEFITYIEEKNRFQEG